MIKIGNKEVGNGRTYIDKKVKAYQSIFPLETRKLVYEKNKGRCSYCGISLLFKTKEWGGSRSSFCIDHVNGNHFDNWLSNLLPTCRRCNSIKGSRKLESLTNFILIY